jgi:hypothetical protein
MAISFKDNVNLHHKPLLSTVFETVSSPGTTLPFAAYDSSSPRTILYDSALEKVVYWNGSLWSSINTLTQENIEDITAAQFDNSAGNVVFTYDDTTGKITANVSASNITLTDSGNYFTTDNVEAALQQNASALAAKVNNSDLLFKTSLRPNVFLHGANLQQYLYESNDTTLATTGISYDETQGGLKLVGADRYLTLKVMMPIHHSRTYRAKIRLKAVSGSSVDCYGSVIYYNSSQVATNSGAGFTFSGIPITVGKDYYVDFTPTTTAKYACQSLYLYGDLGIIIESYSIEELSNRLESFTRTLPTVVGNTVELFYATFQTGLNTYNLPFDVSYTCSAFASAAKSYILPVMDGYSSTAYENWQTLQPISGKTARYGSNITEDFEVDVLSDLDGNRWKVRFRKTVGESSGSIKIFIKKVGVELLDTTQAATATNVSTPAIFRETVLHNHDDRHYTKTELSNDTSASVHWNNISNIPTFVDASAGTARSIAKWTNNDTLTSSIISENLSAITITGSLDVTSAATLSTTLAVTGATTLTTLSATSITVSSTITSASTITGTKLYATSAAAQTTPVNFAIYNTTSKEIEYATTANVKTALGITSDTLNGTGTASKLAKFSDADTLTDSIISESGTVITVAGSIAATSASLSSTLAVTGAATLASTLAVTGDTTVADLSASKLNVSGETILASTLSVAGATTVADLSATTISVSGAATLSSTLNVTGATTLDDTSATTLTVTGDTTLTTLSATAAIFSGDVTFSSQAICSTAPTLNSHLTNKLYVDSLLQGYRIKEYAEVIVLTNVAISNPGTAVFDGVTLTSGARVLLAGQTASSENGIYIFNSSTTALTRSADANVGTELQLATISIAQGTKTGYTYRVNETSITLGTTAITFSAIQTPTNITASNVGATGTGVFKQKAGTDLEFKKLRSENSILTITSETDTVAFEIIESDIDRNAAGGGALTVANGGTGSSTAAGARANLGAVGKYSTTITGNNSTTVFTVTHSLGLATKRDFTYTMFQTDSGTDVPTFATVLGSTVNAITVKFGTAPTSSETFYITVIG